jgi:hypothetical protein
MSNIVGGIIIAVIVFAIYGKVARYFEKQKAAKRDYDNAKKEAEDMN